MKRNMYLIEKLKQDLSKAVADATGEAADESLLEYPELSENGDLAFPCFALAKKLKKAPAAIAAELAATLSSRAQPRDLFARIEAKGPYLNFFLDRAALLEAAVAEIDDRNEAFGDYVRGQGSGVRGSRAQRVMIEYISPNNNKPLHLGHVRNGLLGASLSALLESQGYEVIRALLLNDRGLAVAKVMVAYRRWHDGQDPADLGKKGDHYVGDLYVEYEKASKAGDETLEKEAHEVIRKWEDGDAETRALWRKISDWAEAGQEATYSAYGFKFDTRYKESDIYKEGKGIVEAGLAKGVFVKDPTGAVIAPLEAHGLPDKVLLRADGTTLYITQDLHLAKKKFEEHALDRSLYVVGNEQNLHFRQLFKILELLGMPWAPKLAHLSYGYVTLPEGRMKSREGTVVDADDLLSELESEAALEIKQRHATVTDDELARRAHQVALAAVKFHFLDVDVASDMTYDPKASLAFTGKTGPYLQYMHARICSILRKDASFVVKQVEGVDHIAGEEFRLAWTLARFPEATAAATSQLRPSLVAGHLYETAKSFAAFYEKCAVLKASPKDRERRLRLVEASGLVLKKGLSLLGIAAPEEM